MFLLMCGVALVLAVIAYLQDPRLSLGGVKDGLSMMVKIMPIIVPAFIAVGLLTKFIYSRIL